MSSNKSCITCAAVILSVFGLVTLGGVVGIRYIFDQAIEEKVDPALYSEIVNENDKYLLSSFSLLPKAIDPAAEPVSFYYSPPFLQGGAILCLRLRLPKEKIAKLVSELEASGRSEVDSFGSYSPSFSECGFPESHKDIRDQPLPPGFRIFIEADYETRNGRTPPFTAVSVEKQEVIYYVITYM